MMCQHSECAPTPLFLLDKCISLTLRGGSGSHAVGEDKSFLDYVFFVLGKLFLQASKRESEIQKTNLSNYSSWTFLVADECSHPPLCHGWQLFADMISRSPGSVFFFANSGGHS